LDLGRSDFDSELEANVVLDNIENTIKCLKKWMKDVPVDTPILCAPAKSRLHYDPLGVTLIISAWNYPLFTLFEPLVSNIAAGNVALMKPSENSPNTSRVMKRMIDDMDQDYFRATEGDVKISSFLTSLKFDLIAFTGGS